MGKTAEIILNLIINNPKITKPEIASLTGLSLRGVEWNIQQLKSTGRLTRIGPNKGGYWKVTEDFNKNDSINDGTNPNTDIETTFGGGICQPT